MNASGDDRDDPDRTGMNRPVDGAEAFDLAPDPEGQEEGQTVSPDIQSYIGAQLRAVYDDVAKQPIPDRFLQLMKQLG